MGRKQAEAAEQDPRGQAALEKEAAEAVKARDDGDEAKAVRVKAPDGRPRDTAQRNFTDPKSKIMRATMGRVASLEATQDISRIKTLEGERRLLDWD